MIIGVPCEMKKDEYRVAMLPVGAQLLVQDGHQVLIEKDAGLGSGYSNEDYERVGAEIIETPDRTLDFLILKDTPLEHDERLVRCYWVPPGTMRLGFVPAIKRAVQINLFASHKLRDYLVLPPPSGSPA